MPVVVPRVPDQRGPCGYGLADALPHTPVLHQGVVALGGHERDVLLDVAAVHHELSGPYLRGCRFVYTRSLRNVAAKPVPDELGRALPPAVMARHRIEYPAFGLWATL